MIGVGASGYHPDALRFLWARSSPVGSPSTPGRTPPSSPDGHEGKLIFRTVTDRRRLEKESQGNRAQWALTYREMISTSSFFRRAIASLDVMSRPKTVPKVYWLVTWKSAKALVVM